MDPRSQPCRLMLLEVFEAMRGEKLDFGGRAGSALKDFLHRQPEVTVDQVRERWARALDLGDRYPGCATVHQFLDGRWNELAPRTDRNAGATLQAKARSTHGGARHLGLIPAATREAFLREAKKGAGRRS